jgi:transcriptional regulator with XRE-family HTH domain
MSTSRLRQARLRAGLTQARLAASVGVSQGYLSLLESGRRAPSPALARRLAARLRLPPTALPFDRRALRTRATSAHWLSVHLATLGYPGFAYLERRGARAHPAEVLLRALATEGLEPRVSEALPWLLLRYGELDTLDLVEAARELNVQNRLGFVVSLALALASRSPELSHRVAELEGLRSALEPYRLAREDDLGQPFRSRKTRAWVSARRSPAARHWNLLTDMTPDGLPYAS